MELRIRRVSTKAGDGHLHYLPIRSTPVEIKDTGSRATILDMTQRIWPEVAKP
jgi:hypothetical protein